MLNARDTNRLQGSGQGCDGHWTEAILDAGGQGTLISKPTKKVANKTLGIPFFCAHPRMKSESFCTNVT